MAAIEPFPLPRDAPSQRVGASRSSRTYKPVRDGSRVSPATPRRWRVACGVITKDPPTCKDAPPVAAGLPRATE